MQQPTRNKKNISLIIPVYNEEQNISPIIESILSFCDFYELIFVDDGSTDGTLQAIKDRAGMDPRIKYISFARNFGHQVALKAGYDYASGDCAISLDGDLQHPPSLIPTLLKYWDEGYAVVNTRRNDVQASSWFKKYTSFLFYKLFNKISKVKIHENTSDFRLIDASVLKVCKDLQEDSFFWRGLIPWMGFHQITIDYLPAQRAHGKSKYSLKKMLSLTYDGIVSFSLLPLRLSLFLGLMALFFSTVYMFYIVITFFLGKTVTGWSSLALLVLFFSSINLIFFGIIGEYVGKVYMSSKKRPLYIVKDKG